MTPSPTLSRAHSRTWFGLWCLLASLGCSAGSPPQGATPEEAVPVSAVPAGGYPTQDAALRWQPWNAVTIASARRLQRPLLLYVATAGADGIFTAGDALAVSLAEERFVPVRVDPWLHPELDRRYGGSWPALAVVSPEGDLIARAVDIAPGRVRTFLLRLADHLARRPEVVEAHLVQARSLAAAAGTLRAGSGEGSAAMPERVVAAAVQDFDAFHGGFGGPRKHPEATLLRFLQRFAVVHPASPAPRLLERCLDAIVASEIWGGAAGPFVYADTPDWRLPRREVDAAVVAGLLPVFAGQGAVRASHRLAFEELLRFVSDHLYDGDRGVFAGRRLPLTATTWWTDPTLYADRIAYMILSLYEIEPYLGARGHLTRMRRAAARTLMTMTDETGVVAHAFRAGVPVGARGLLRDQMLASLALTRAGEAAGRREWSAAGARAYAWARQHLFDEAAGVFVDALAPEGLSHWPRRAPFADDVLPAGNVLAAQVLRRRGQIDAARRLLQAAPMVPPVRAHASAAATLLSLRDDA